MSKNENRPARAMGHGPMGGRGPAEKAKDFKGTARRLIRYLRPQLPKLIVVFCFAVAATVFTVKSPKIIGDATNLLTDGFIAKSTVNSVQTMQEKLVPSVKDMLNKIDTGESEAVRQADAAVEQAFAKQIAEKKQAAYDSAVKAADAAVAQKFQETMTAKKQQAYAAAVKAADDAVTKQFSQTVAEQKQQAYDEAVTAADQKIASLPPEQQTPEMKQQAEAQAKAKVDEQFVAQQSTMDQKLAAAKQQAEAKAKDTVDKQFAAQQSTMDAQLATAKQQAETQAKAAVDDGFAKQQATMDQQLATAKQQAEAKAKDAVMQAVLSKSKMTQEQFNALKQIAAEPYVKTISDNNKKADTVNTVFTLMKKLPTEYTKKIPAVSQSDLDKGISDVRKYGGAIPFGEIWKTLMWLLTVFVLSALCTFAMQFIMSDVAQKTVKTLRREVDEKLSRLPLKYFDSNSYGDILSRVTNDIDTISTTLQQSLTQVITSVLQIIGYIWMMITIDLVLTLIVLATLPIYMVVTLLITKRSQKFYAAQQKYLGQLTGHTEEMYAGHVVVKAFGREKVSYEKFSSVNDSLYNSGWKAQFFSGIMMPLMNFIGNIGYVLIAVVGGIFVTKSYLNLGDIVSFISYSKSFSQPIVSTANIANVIQSAVACAERVFQLLDEEEQLPDPEDAAVLSDPQGNIRFDQVRFRYREDVPLIENMNLTVNRGDTIAIVGPTGAGKTTLVNLLMRFYEIGGGSLTFDGVDVRNMRRGDLRTMFGMVLQDTWLFNGTIRDNIGYGRENATEEEIVRAAKAAHADHFIRSLPQGYDTVLNEEASNISQGQKQLLTIARAILADPTVLILDEATSSVDTRTEVLIQRAMGTLMKGRTNFVIAHRLSTIRDAQMILVMNHGAIIEKGTHDFLMQKGGFYAELYNSQFAGKEI